ncbi:MAG: hypothetical protein PF517_18730 [Salinivirgaceae bacterium]|jgi:enamine deaminase RidA (YjgF/YER057c/UK114 family)|nr:hypothetical protein [Salinivirgaceae bacterium]
MKIDFFIDEAKGRANREDELVGVLEAFDQSLNTHNILSSQIVKLAVFYNSSQSNGYLETVKRSMKKHFCASVPPISFIAQPPQEGQNLIFEVGYVEDVNVKISYYKHNEVSYAKAVINNEEHIFISGLQSDNWNIGMQEHSEFTFEALKTILDKEGFVFSDIIRQWNYIEGIIDSKDGDQNYQIFNDVRTQYYNDNGLTSRYPAATGIGIKEGGVIIEAHALKPHNSLQLAEIANSLQIDAFDYSEKVLEGKALEGLFCKTTPKFSRAKLVVNSKQAQVLVSGTASIIGEETIGLNSVAEQTEYTIKNIFQLIEPALLGSFNEACVKAPQDFSSVRVYVKNKADINEVRKICEKYFATSNILYVEADICRDNLLVEIESVVSLALRS